MISDANISGMCLQQVHCASLDHLPEADWSAGFARLYDNEAPEYNSAMSAPVPQAAIAEINIAVCCRLGDSWRTLFLYPWHVRHADHKLHNDPRLTRLNAALSAHTHYRVVST